jgi:cytoskeletal protein CcmA (bactofilin family)
MPISLSGSLVITGSITTTGGITISGSILSASYSDTASFSNNFRVLGDLTASTALVTGTLTAQTLVVQTVTSSIVYSSGSNIFGSQLSDRQTFTGSVNITGSLTVNTTGTEFQVTNAGVVMGNLLTDNHRITGSLSITGSQTVFGNVIIGSATSAGAERFGVTRDDGVADGLHIIADFNRAGSSSSELILGYFASASAAIGPVVYAANSQPLLFSAGSVERMRITIAGNVGIGTTSVNGLLSLKASPSDTPVLRFQNSITSGLDAAISTYVSSTQTFLTLGTNCYINSVGSVSRFNASYESSHISFDSGIIVFSTGTTSALPSTRMNILSTGQIGINTGSPVSTSLTGSITIYKAYNADQASVPSTTAQAYYGNQHGLYLFGRNSGLSIISANSEEGSIKFGNASTAVYATIGTATGTSAVGGDMYFRLGSDGERLRITTAGYVKATTDGSTGISMTGNYHEFVQKVVGNTNTYFYSTGNTYASTIIVPIADRAASSAYSFLKGLSSGGNDTEFDLRGDGTGYSDGGWTTPAADYAEYFESFDGTAFPIGSTVALNNDKIVLANEGDIIIGVVRPKDAQLFLGNNAQAKWGQKYLKNDYGSYLKDENDERIINPNYDSTIEYISRENRPEWNVIGLMGQIPIKKGQPINPNWIKMKDISDTVEQWLVK